jgi:hypothetical protein
VGKKNKAKRLAFTLGILYLLGFAIARSTIFHDLQNSHYTICPFYNLFHHPCPSCGMTMGILHTMRFEFHEAMLQNPLSPFVLLASFLVFFYASTSIIADIPRPTPKMLSLLGLLSSLVVVVTWITRLLPAL